MRISDDQVIEVDEKKNKKREINKEEVLKSIAKDNENKKESERKEVKKQERGSSFKEIVSNKVLESLKKTKDKDARVKDFHSSKDSSYFNIDKIKEKFTASSIKKNDNKFKYIMVFLLGMIIAFAGFYAFNDYLVSNKPSNTEEDLSKGIENVYDSVVYIENFRVGKPYTSGTGFVYKVDDNYGYILTNYHVVYNNTSIKVTYSNDKTVNAYTLGGDEYLDIACLRVDKDSVLKVANLGSSKDLKLGATLFTVGSPVGDEYRGTVTKGILSGKDRMVSVATSSLEEDYVMKVLQTDAAMNPGNSGGPLCNINGEVIGINSMKLVKDTIEGMGFALPIDSIRNHLTSLEKNGKIARPYLGVAIFNLSNKSTFSYYGFDETIDTELKDGVVVQEVKEGGSAFGKLEKGDIVVKVNNNEVADVAHFRYELFKYEVGDKITITVERAGKLKDVNITLKDK